MAEYYFHLHRKNTRPIAAQAFLLACFSLLLSGVCRAQPDTEVYLAPLERQGATFILGTPENISRNPGYDNQPSFVMGKELLLYARTRNGQTDIASYDPQTRHTRWITDTPGGSEYSPLHIPDAKKDQKKNTEAPLRISAIRLDTTGLQRLYTYSGDRSEVLLTDLKVGYHTWMGPDLLVCTVLREDRMDLVVARPKAQSAYIYQKQVGRSLSRIPGTDRVSYISLEEGSPWVKSMDPLSGATDPIVQLPDGVQDVCWLPDASLLCGKGSVLLRCVPAEGSTWEPWQDLGPGFGDISRLALPSEGTYLALVIEKPETP